MAENKFNFTFGFLRADNTKVYPSFDAFYGPYESVAKAHQEISAILGAALPVGLKFGVVGTDGIFHEHYYKSGNRLEDIAENVSVVDTELNPNSNNALSNGVASREMKQLKEQLEELKEQLLEQLKSV